MQGCVPWMSQWLHFFSLSYSVQLHHTWELYELPACTTVDGLTMLFGPFLSYTSVLPYTFPVEQGPFTDQEDLAISVFPLQAAQNVPFLFPRLRLNHHSRLRSNHLGGWQRKYTSLLHGGPFLNVGRAAFFRSCISGALTDWCGCQLSLGRSDQGSAFLTHPRSRYLSNLQQV